jgi:type VI secretion system protein ImpE
MNASDLFKAGKLGAAIDAQLGAVKAHPTDPQRRLFLFELAMFAGDLDRAAKQGALVNFPEAEINATMDGYRLLTEAEKMRRRVLHEGEKPKSFGPLPPECTARIEMLKCLLEGHAKDAMEILENNSSPKITGTCDEKPFESIGDGDEVLEPILEVCTNQGYFWVPFSTIISFATVGPKTPRDLYWIPGTLTLTNGDSGPVFLPALYVDSYKHAEDSIKLGKATEWAGGDGEPYRGRGAKTLRIGNDDVGLLDVRNLEIQQT